jgi:PAS domain S-box-containing protein
VSVNDCLLTLFKYSRAEVVGRPFLTFVHPAHRSASLARYFDSVFAAAAGRTPRIAHSELQCIAADGSQLWLTAEWTMTSPSHDGHQYGVVRLRDVTHSKKIQQELSAVRAPHDATCGAPDRRILTSRRRARR